MSLTQLSVREITEADLDPLLDYWYQASPEHMEQMGADASKLPPREEFRQGLQKQLSAPYPEKMAYAIIWLADGYPVGHCNVNKIQYGEEAYMHLHLWNSERRQRGMGRQLVKLSLPFFFNLLHLERIWCEPYALNPAPNRTLEKVGFTFVKRHTTIPGSLNFEQEVNRWVLEREDFLNQQLEDYVDEQLG